jgi:hypothetical protein
MKILRRRVRRSFLFAAIGFLILGFADIARQDYADRGISPVHHFGFIAFCLIQGTIYAAAWFTTKSPSTYRNNWAVAGSLFTLAYAGYDLWLNHADIMDARGGLIGLVLAIAGLYVFAPGGSPAKLESESKPQSKAESKPVTQQPPTPQGVTTKRPPNEPRVPARTYRIPVDSSAPSASSPTLAAAAVSAQDPNDSRWDPLSAIRSSAAQ